MPDAVSAGAAPDAPPATPPTAPPTPAAAPPPPDAVAEAARLFGQGAQGAPDVPQMPDGYIEKYWTAAKGDAGEYARFLSKGYSELNRSFTQVTQAGPDDPVGESADIYWAGQGPDTWGAKYDRLTFDDADQVNDLFRSAHAMGLGPKRAQALVDGYLSRRQASSPEVESDESRRSRVIHEMGPQGAAMAGAVAAWISGQARAGALTAEEVQSLMPVAETAHGMAALFKMSRASLAAPPSATSTASLEAERDKERDALMQGLADPKTANDPAFIRRYHAFVKDGHTLDGRPVPAAA